MAEDKKPFIDIRILVYDKDDTTEDDIIKISGDAVGCMGSLTSILYNCSIKAGLSKDKLLELITDAFDKFELEDKEKE